MQSERLQSLRPRRKQQGFRLPSLKVAAEIVGGLAGLAVVGSLLWRFFAGTSDAASPERVASLAAGSVADAARTEVLRAAESATDPEAAVRSAAADAVSQAASAGADIVPAALGALDGARIARIDGLDREAAVSAAREGILHRAAGIGPAARDRIEQAIGDGR